LLRVRLAVLGVVSMFGAQIAHAVTLPPTVNRNEWSNQPPNLVVLANNTGLAELDSAALRSVFRGERSQWPSERRVTVVLPSSRAESAGTIARMLFQSSPGGMQRFWLALVFQGRAAPPIFVDSAEEMVAYVRRTPGAIALVPRDSVSSASSLLVRVR
jgi:ABC-type phosphate transport system substrate-binding protein